MLTSTFIHVQGIGYTTERRIWDLGALTWERFLEMRPELKISEGKKALIHDTVDESVLRLSDGDYAYFADVIPSKDHWRALSEFGGDLAYLDIETTGCGYDDQITVIGLYDGYDMQSFIQGINMDEFPEALSRFKMLVTFFGSGFDIPMIRRAFPDLRVDQLHVDLCFLLKRVGLSGGLKKIEHQMGINRRPETEGLDGFDAVRLWNAYRTGSQEALDLLLTYNKDDVMNMEPLLRHGVREIQGKLAFPGAGDSE